ncbi:restriction endonuclease subunit S [Providencia hangzhouensis]|uniref:restriction endonuclease subunit S n=1 Tax=Providencia hangzhouensis TaxID=3031799 RepID=UPI003F1C69A7
MTVEKLITDHIDIWSSALQTRSTAGRGSSGKIDLYGIKKLRELILELAVRGKLVPQDPNDEPAPELLKRIEKEREGLVKSRKIRKSKVLEPVDTSELPFELPRGWEWCYLNDVGNWGAGATPNRSNSKYYDGNIPWFKSGELSSDFISESEEKVTELALKECSLRDNKVGDVLIAMYGATIGKTSILNVRGTTNQAVCACTPYSGISNVYLLTLLKAYKRIFIGMGAGGAQPNISREKLIATVIALPPNAEQNRIVYKVNELMSLCDQLEQQSLTSLDAHQQLVETLLATLTDSQNEKELAENWSRINQHFDTLFTTEASIDALKQTILQLAVMGKLVPQDPNDEPASELLKRIEQEKALMVKNGKIKKQKLLPPISDEEKPFELPQGWEWCRIGDCSLSTEYGISHKTFKSTQGVPVFKMGDIQNGQVNIGGQQVVNSDIDELPYLYLENRDILYNRTNSAELVGKTGIYLGKDNTNTYASYLIRIRTIKSGYMPEFINLNMQAPFFRLTQINPHVKQQCGQANVNGTIMKNMLVAIPSLNEQEKIILKVAQLCDLCNQLISRLQSAQQTQLHLANALTEAALS